MIFDSLDQASAYFPQEWWLDAAAMLESAHALADGDHPVRGKDLFMKLMTFTTGPDPAPITESHRAYADIHIVLTGRERIRVWPASTLAVRQEYDAAKDVAFYHAAPESAATLDLQPGFFAALFPQDAHMPTLAAGSPAEIRKAVFKISTALLPPMVTR